MSDLGHFVSISKKNEIWPSWAQPSWSQPSCERVAKKSCGRLGVVVGSCGEGGVIGFRGITPFLRAAVSLLSCRLNFATSGHLGSLWEKNEFVSVLGSSWGQLVKVESLASGE